MGTGEMKIKTWYYSGCYVQVCPILFLNHHLSWLYQCSCTHDMLMVNFFVAANDEL